MFNDRYNYTKPQTQSKFTLQDGKYSLDDYIRKNGMSAIIMQLVYDFMNNEHENVGEVFDVERFGSYLYTIAARHMYGDDLSKINLEEKPYEPLYCIERTEYVKRKNEPEQPPKDENYVKLENEMTEIKALLTAALSTNGNNHNKQRDKKYEPPKLDRPSQPDNKRSDTPVDGGNS